MRIRLEPVNVCIDVEAPDCAECIAKARRAIEAAGFKGTADGAYWIVRDDRAIKGTDSGSPFAIGWKGELLA